MTETARVSQAYRGRRSFWYIFQLPSQSKIT